MAADRRRGRWLRPRADGPRPERERVPRCRGHRDQAGREHPEGAGRDHRPERADPRQGRPGQDGGLRRPGAGPLDQHVEPGIDADRHSRHHQRRERSLAHHLDLCRRGAVRFGERLCGRLGPDPGPGPGRTVADRSAEGAARHPLRRLGGRRRRQIRHPPGEPQPLRRRGHGRRRGDQRGHGRLHLPRPRQRAAHRWRARPAPQRLHARGPRLRQEPGDRQIPERHPGRGRPRRAALAGDAARFGGRLGADSQHQQRRRFGRGCQLPDPQAALRRPDHEGLYRAARQVPVRGLQRHGKGPVGRPQPHLLDHLPEHPRPRLWRCDPGILRGSRTWPCSAPSA